MENLLVVEYNEFTVITREDRKCYSSCCKFIAFETPVVDVAT